MTAMYDTAKQFNRILYWDDDNRLTKTVDTTSVSSVPTQYHYDAKGMRIVKEGPYGKSIYVDTGYVESGAPQTTAPIVSNHIFVGNTRVASVVKHTEEKNSATYYYASDHLGSSSVLTTQQGIYHERIEYLPYGETWVEDKATSDSYTTPYKFTGKELDAETGLYYFGARYYDARLSRWISTDPALEKYLPKPNDYDTEHDFYWYLQQDGSKKLAGLGGVFNAVNMDVYHYAGNNPMRYIDPDGNTDRDIERGKGRTTDLHVVSIITGNITNNEGNVIGMKGTQMNFYYSSGGEILFDYVPNVEWAEDENVENSDIPYEHPALTEHFTIFKSEKGAKYDVQTSHSEGAIMIHEEGRSEGCILTSKSNIGEQILSDITRRVLAGETLTGVISAVVDNRTEEEKNKAPLPK